MPHTIPTPIDIFNADDTPWTFVKPKNRRGRKPTSKPHSHARAHPHDTPAPLKPRTQGLSSVADLDAEYRKVRAQWEESACCAHLRALVAVRGPVAGRVSRAVCLGIGTFDPDDGAWEARRKTFVQLIACLVMVEELERLLDATIPCIFQEPIFTAPDKAFLSSLGHRVVDSPAGCAMVDQDTLLFAVHLYRPIYAMALEHACPAIFVGTGWDVWDEVTMASSSPSHDLANMQAMEQTHAKSKFHQDASTTAFSSTSIYWRVSSSPDSDSVTTPADTSPHDQDQADQADLADRLASTKIS